MQKRKERGGTIIVELLSTQFPLRTCLRLQQLLFLRCAARRYHWGAGRVLSTDGAVRRTHEPSSATIQRLRVGLAEASDTFGVDGRHALWMRALLSISRLWLHVRAKAHLIALWRLELRGR